MRSLFASVLTALLATAGCGSDTERPPDSVVNGVKDPVSCSDARLGGHSGGFLTLDGGQARCFPDGLECPVSDIDSFADACTPPQLPGATCIGSRWQITCTQPGDGGVPADASNDG